MKDVKKITFSSNLTLYIYENLNFANRLRISFQKAPLTQLAELFWQQVNNTSS